MLMEDVAHALPTFAALVVIAAILSALRVASTLALGPEPWACAVDSVSSFTDIYMGGVSTGSFLLLALAMGQNLSIRQSMESRAALIIFASCMFHFTFVAAGVAPVVCVRAMGGYSDEMRPQLPQQYLYWLCSTAPMLMALGRMVQLPVHAVRSVGAIFISLLVTGAVATFSTNFIVWIVATAVSFCCHVAVSVYLLRMYNAAEVQSGDNFTRYLVRATRPYSVCIWALFPLLWLLGQLSVLTPTQEWLIWPIIDFGAKGAIATLLVLGSFHAQSAQTLGQLAEAESRQLEAKSAKDAVTRQFLRWTLHELRVPLQGAALAVQELCDGLDSGELVAAGDCSNASSAAAAGPEFSVVLGAAAAAAAGGGGREHTVVQVASAGAAAGAGGALPALRIPADSRGSQGAAAAASEATAQFREAGETAVSNIQVVSKLLDDFLSLSKIEDGRMELEPTDVQVRPWLTELTSVFVNLLRAKHIQLHVSVSNDVPDAMHADGNKLRQVLSNYISNAIKFSPHDRRIKVRLELAYRSPTHVVAQERPPSSTGIIAAGGGGGASSPAASKGGGIFGLFMRPRPRNGGSNRKKSGGVDGGNDDTSGDDSDSGTGTPSTAALTPSSSAAAAGGRGDNAWIIRKGAGRLRSSGGGRGGRADRDGGGLAVERPPVGAMPFLHVYVEDHGPGIAADEIKLLFQPYAQIRAGAQQKGGGTGLGLALCKKIVEMSGGAVGVVSEVGKGSRFWFEVPLLPVEATTQVSGTRADTDSSPIADNVGGPGSAPGSAVEAALSSSAVTKHLMRSQGAAAFRASFAASMHGGEGGALTPPTTARSGGGAVSARRGPGPGPLGAAGAASPRTARGAAEAWTASAPSGAPRVDTSAPRVSPVSARGLAAPAVAAAAAGVSGTGVSGTGGGPGLLPSLPEEPPAQPDSARLRSTPTAAALPGQPLPDWAVQDSRFAAPAAAASAKQTLVASAGGKRPAVVPLLPAIKGAAPPPPLGGMLGGGGGGGGGGMGSSPPPSLAVSHPLLSPSSSSSLLASPLPAAAAPRLRTITRVVVVDDMYANRELFARQLRRYGCEVVFTADDGQQCLDKLAALLGVESGGGSDDGGETGRLADQRIDAWFVDGVMPVMDGLELTVRLRGCGVTAPIIAVTGNALDDDRLQFTAAGATAVLAKPCLKLHELLAESALRLPRGGVLA